MSIVDDAKAVIQGIIQNQVILATDEDAKARYSICESCPLFLAETKKCLKCGCYMPAKVHIAAMRCPDDPPKWVSSLPISQSDSFPNLD